MTEPLVWVASATGTIPVATAPADPLDEPPGVLAGSCGLRVAPGVRNASSAVTVLPRMMAPPARNRETMVASVVGLRPLRIGVPHSVGMSNVSMMSFTPTGSPCNGPSG
jgi:hypothetical protein